MSNTRDDTETAAIVKNSAGHVSELGAREVFERRIAGESYQAIAEALGLSMHAVYCLCKGRTKTWADLRREYVDRLP